MKLTTFARHAAALLVAAVLTLTAAPLWAQTVLTSTTLASAISDTSGLNMSVASATSFAAPGTGATRVLALVDKEIVGVRTVSGTVIGITRGLNGTRATTHVSGATVWVGPPDAFQSYVPAGQCLRSSLKYVPWIVGGGPGLGVEVGSTYDCLGVTSAGQWVQTNANGVPVLGSTVASVAGVMTLTGSVLKVSGALAVTGITVPAGTAPGFCFYIEPTGAFTTTTATNIVIASTAVVGKLLLMCWDGAKWSPSY
jgi:hypothetical protein